jgi:hypothetical protein
MPASTLISPPHATIRRTTKAVPSELRRRLHVDRIELSVA